MSKIAPIVTTIKTGINAVSQNGSEKVRVAERYISINHIPAKDTRRLKAQAWITGAFRPIVEALNKVSDNFAILTGTTKSINRNINKHVNTRAEGVTKAQAGFSALKESIPQLKDAMKEVGGINDVKSAMKEEGVLKAIQEGGKAVTRVATSLGLAIVGTCTPIPAGTFAGWVAGEKLVNTCLGKPFTKQAKNILK